MQRPQVKIGLLSLMLLTASVGVAVAQSSIVTGVVRDAQGVAQLGALVQVIADDSALVGTAFTDIHGRYLVPHLAPGTYEVRATAALFVPAMRANLQLRSGAQAVVNLTLNTLFETTTWLPAERRKADEPSDDWKWTLRSAANRPILRMQEDGDGKDELVVSSSVTEVNNKHPERAQASVMAGDGGFGSNGVHNVFTLDRVMDDRSNLYVRADVGTPVGPSALGPTSFAPSTDMATGFETNLGFAGAARTVVSYQSHPEIVSSDGTPGLEVMRLSSAEQMKLGDSVDVEAGGTVYVVRTADYAAASRPFLKVTVHPHGEWMVGYRMATAQDLQSFGGLDSIQQELPVAAVYQGREQTEHGMHQEFSVGRKTGEGQVQVAYYRDGLGLVAVAGGGASNPASLGGQGGIVADATTGDFRFLNAGYSTQGVSVSVTEPITQSMFVAVEYATGQALVPKGDGTLAGVQNGGMTTEAGQTATVALRGRVVRSGTRIRAAYRWQPTRMVSAIDPYAPFSDQAYLSCYIRQSLRLGHLLPQGLDATVDVTNLLAQGYRPFLSPDGQTIFLAQSPRALQAGLAFTF